VHLIFYERVRKLSGSHNDIEAKENNPKHFMVLDAISKGMDDIGKIAKVTKLHKAEVELAVNELATQRLVLASAKKRRLFGRRELQVSLTLTGKRLLEEKKKQLEKKASELRNYYRNGDMEATQSFMNENRAWLPMMIFSGLMSAVMFASIMSFAGMAMNPAESAMASEAANAGSHDDPINSGAGESSYETADSSMGVGGTNDIAESGGSGTEAGADFGDGIGGDWSGEMEF
jgi:DNA-binding MarR family transcriptional regulator